ncbi:MAG TPA: phosphoribosylamine--glycine ligase [Solirubrobacteraceae bacterium]|nr:phosphoribosylamine--glycine ligase [Solirubrobacteraceae bacterium]
MRTLIVGHGGRESALAARMAEHSELYAFAGHANPSLVRYSEASGGKLRLGDVCDAEAVAAFARESEIDLAMISADEPLEAGVVDALLAQGTRAVGPTRAGAEIEWNKAFARELLLDVAPEATPRLRVIHALEQVEEAIASFGATPVVVKPSGLTGGKGVKVMGPHLASHAEAAEYARALLLDAGPGDSVLIEEKIVGAEFTIQAISDGRTVVFPPSTYDYPFRFDGDEGPGTGGMGSLTMAAPTLPFMSAEHYAQACSIIERVIARLHQEGRRFTGVMNGGFFATADGVRVIEFNARFGDPECMNIMALFEGSWPRVMERICAGELVREDVALREQASLVLYLVSPDYALASSKPPRTYEFELDVAAIERAGCEVFFASSIALAENSYRTVGTSRAVALVTTAPTLPAAHERIVACAGSVPTLQWRREVGDESYLHALSGLVGAA